MPALPTSRDLDFPGAIARGAKGRKARLVQEWLCLNGHAVVVDGDFGPATDAAVATFRAARDLGPDGHVDRATFEALVAPMRRALATPGDPPADLGLAVLAVARRHLAEHPREVGGQNRGPWVRLYMDGHEGDAWPWCAGFVCLAIRQACAALGRPLPFPKTFSCDVLATQAQARGLFVRERERTMPNAAGDLPPGTVFLNRRVVGDWTHTGFVVEGGRETFATIEGNTNDEGGREGHEVCARVRGYRGKDFVRLAP